MNGSAVVELASGREMEEVDVDVITHPNSQSSLMKQTMVEPRQDTGRRDKYERAEIKSPQGAASNVSQPRSINVKSFHSPAEDNRNGSNPQSSGPKNSVETSGKKTKNLRN